MLSIRALLLLLSLLFAPALRAADEPTDTAFLEGCAAYDAGRFAEAKGFFEKILTDSKKLSADLFYNLGCTEAKLDEPGRAAMWFHRTLLLDPRHREARQNLRYLSKKEAFLAFSNDGLDLLASYAKPSFWRLSFWISVWLVALSIAVLVWLRPRIIWPVIVVLCLAAVGGIAGGIGYYVRSHQLSPEQIYGISEKGLTAFNAPAESADTVISLNPGTQVRPLESRGKWSYIELPGDPGTRGWIRTEHLEPLWPFAPELIH